MPPDRPPKRWIPSLWFEMALGLIALLSVLPAPIAGLTLDTALGRALYIAAVLLAAAGLAYARRREERRRDYEQARRDIAAVAAAASQTKTILTEQKSQFDALLAKQDESLQFLKAAVGATKAVGPTGPTGEPLLRVIEAAGSGIASNWQRYVAGMMARQGYAGPSGPLGPDDLIVPSGPVSSATTDLPEATRLLQEITRKPPTTQETVSTVTQQLTNYVKDYILPAQPANFKLTSPPAKLVRRDKNGNVIEER